MGVTASAIAVVSTATLLVSACRADTGAVNGAHATSAPSNFIATAATASPSRAADPRGSAGSSVFADAASPPDADGNPACPAFDSWGKASSATGIVVAYWSHGADYVTVLVRMNAGPDVARSVNVERGQALQLFEFPDTNPMAVGEVLIITNDKRCYATLDPAISRR
jgi:hypothetical protein